MNICAQDIKEIVGKTNLKHIAIIMDGNRRWAKERMLPTMVGHKKGVEALKKTVKACAEYGVKYLTVYAFSTENWNRPKQEVDFLMDLLATTMKNELLELHQNNVKLNFIGNLSQLSESLQETLQNAIETTKDNDGVNLNIAINYGARDEITHAIKNIIDKGIKKEDINEEVVSKYLYTSSCPDPDLLIRTGGEHRISNYLLWQIAYCEICVVEKYWPEFDGDELAKAIEDFAGRNRRWGK